MMVAVWSVGLVALWLLARRRVPPSAALGYAAIGFLGVELVVLLVNPLLGLALPWLEVGVWVVIVAAAIVARVGDARRGSGTARPSGRSVALGVAAASGAILVVAGTALAQVVPGALRIAWAMNSDAVNVVAFARELLFDGGIDPSASGSPTPLPFAMLASAAAPGRENMSDAALAGHDIAALAALWVVLLALGCVLAGAIAARSVASVRTPLAVGATAVASLLGTTWYVLGVQFQFGFLNIAFAIALLLAAWLVYLDAEERPALGLAALVLAVAVLLSVWSPLVIVVIPLGVIVAVRQWRSILASGWRGLAPVAASAVLTLVYLVGITVPQYLAISSFLAADGGFPAIGPSVIIATIGVGGLAAALAARLRRQRHALIGVLGAILGLAVGLGFLLAQRWGAEVTWGYYPAKFAWAVSILLLMIAIGSVATMLDGVRRRTDAIAVAFGLVLLMGIVWAPSEPQDPISQLPLAEILKGDAFGLTNDQAETVLALTGRENGHHLLWQTPYDQWGNRWLLQLDVDDFDTNPVKAYAYLPALTATDVCTAIELLGDDVTVHTTNPDVESVLVSTCPDAEFSVEFVIR